MSRRPASVWPDTTGQEPPTDHLYASALWLLGRHPQLAGLVDRLPGVAAGDDEDGDDGQRFLDLDLLADAVTAFDADRQAWQDYRRRTREPDDDPAWQRWRDAGPPWPDTGAGRAGQELACMSRTEQVRLRLLAAFAPAGARFAVWMLGGFDDAGQDLIGDWLEAVRDA